MKKLIMIAAALVVSAGALQAKGLEGVKGREWKVAHSVKGAKNVGKVKDAGSAWTELKLKGKAVWAKLPGVENKGVYGVDHCSPYDDTMVPAKVYGEEGPHCVSRNPAAVICHEPRVERVFEGELGWVDRVVGCGRLTPPGGFAGPGPDQGTQAP